MSNWEEQKGEFFQWGILPIDEVPHDVLYYLKNKFGDKSHNHELAGHIRKEFAYENWPNFVEEFIIEKAGDPFLDRLMEKYQVLSSSRPFKLKSLWVNLQKKHEFNPVHYHGGLFSFIIFLKIPYDLKKEDDVFPPTSSGHSTSRLCFLMSDGMGDIFPINVNADKSFEGKMLMFSSKVNHLVYPFYTSDDYRMTVSGNVVFDVEKEK